MNNLSFSVAMCVYKGDNPLFFEQAINSVLNNTILPEEIILVVDGPLLVEHDLIINKFKNQLKIYRFALNQGHGKAREKSLELCKNEIVALMDSDDICIKDRFEKQIKELNKNKNISVIGGQIEEFIGKTDNIVGRRSVPCNDEEIKKYMQRRCPMNLVTAMFKKSDVIEAGGFIDWYCEEDYYLWLRMFLKKMVFSNVKDVLVKVRVGDEMYKRRGGWKYFKSEYYLQNYMLENKVINRKRWLFNILQRFILQILMPNKLRGFIFRKIARE